MSKNNGINSLSRADLIKNGTLIDLSDYAKRLGFEIPVAVTSVVFEGVMIPDTITRADGETKTGRVYECLWSLRRAIQVQTKTNPVYFEFRVQMQMEKEKIGLKASFTHGDNSELVLTIMGLNEE